MTPLRLDTGGVVIVNRGFVPQERASPEARGEANLTEDTVTISGLLRAPEIRAPFAPQNDPANDDWYLRDPREIAEARGIADVAPFTVDAAAVHTPPGSLPQAGETRISIRNNHLQYALTWYALAVVLLIMSGLWFRQESRRRKTGATRAHNE
jgi:surfeit locus 1 family protein